MSDPFEMNSSLGYADVPVINLGGREFFVPTLVMRQNRLVVPKIASMFPTFMRLQGELATGNAAAAAAALTTETVDTMLEIVVAALTRAYPKLRVDDMLDLPITPLELVESIATISKQSGFFKAKEEGDTPAGEAETSQLMKPTSTG